ncbi:MAG: hypothetical protein HQK62_07290 [Desulfamplus sp.]|nr:hypothetical protein [Desulfamplus sp.]
MAIPFYINFDRHVSEIPKAALIEMCKPLQKNGGRYQISSLMRSFIINERDYLKITYMRGQRNFWYMTIKPALEKLGQLTESDLTEDALTKWDGELSRYIGDLSKKEGLTYLDLNIEDNSRKLEIPARRFASVSLSTYGYQVAIAPYSNLILCSEKDTVFHILSDIASLFGCTCLSGKGQNARAATEKLLRRINIDGGQIILLAMTDYDPSGYDISNTFKKQIEEILPVLGQVAEVRIERVGIRPDQLSEDEVENNKYSPKESNKAQMKRWMNATGGINGEFKGLELDALSPDKIRSIFAASLKKYVETEQYSTFIKHAYVRKQVLESALNKINSIVDEAIKRESGAIEIYDFDIFEMAKEGHNTVPVSSLCSGNRDYAIHEMTIESFR